MSVSVHLVARKGYSSMRLPIIITEYYFTPLSQIEQTSTTAYCVICEPDVARHAKRCTPVSPYALRNYNDNNLTKHLNHTRMVHNLMIKESLGMQATRERILNILKQRGQVTVDELSQELGLTAVTVRHHLDILRGEGLVSTPLARRRKAPGRPKHVYTLTEKASGLFPKRYDRLTAQILDEVRLRFSPDEVGQMMKRIGERIANRATLPSGDDFEIRLVAVVEYLKELGYMPRWEQDGDGGYMIHIANCPYERIALQDRAVCAIDLALLTRLLGSAPQRVASAAQGDHQCAYVVYPSTD
jgi:predicted ArsR family transcriptional regulator